MLLLSFVRHWEIRNMIVVPAKAPKLSVGLEYKKSFFSCHQGSLPLATGRS